ncbi:FUSC family protein [Rhizobium sp. RAF56]|uniref:FUSC family protein n=1 Tax=Rhizobium sp. RAF56 TaxID=3233062 RepID=UPI003F9E5541
MNSSDISTPALSEVVFSLKTFAAAMLALFIALCFDLQNPYWAVGTVYIVSHPLSGASTSKALYRLLGTAIGGAMTIVLVPNLVNAPELLTLAISLWMGICLAVSLLDRTPRSYVFMLAGYTTALTGFPIVASPDTAFVYVVARVTEIVIGILCAAIVSRVFFPQHAGPVLAKRIDRWLAGGANLAIGMLEGRHDDPDLAELSQRLAADAVDLRGFTTHVAYDPADHGSIVTLARTLQRRMVAMLPMASGLGDALKALARETDGAYTPAIRALVADATAWLKSGRSLDEDQRRDFLGTMEKAEAEAAKLPRWQGLVIQNVIARLRDLIQIWSDCIDLKQDIVSGSHHDLRWRRFGSLLDLQPMHKDYGMAIYSGLAAMIATWIASAFWIMTGWAQGGAAAMMAGVLTCIFSTMDDPAPTMRKFLNATIVAVGAAFAFQFGVMPLIHGYIPLAAALGLILVPLGVLMARQSTMLVGMAFCVNLPNILSLQGRLSLDLESFINSNAALILGLAIACGTTALIRSFGAEWSVHRLLSAGWRDIESAAREPRSADIDGLTHRMLDRFGLVAPRLANLPAQSPALETDIIRDLRNGLNTIELQRHKSLLPAARRATVDTVLAEIAERYENARGDTGSDQDSELLSSIDRSLAALDVDRSTATEGCLRALTGLRYSLFAAARPFGAANADTTSTTEPAEQAA